MTALIPFAVVVVAAAAVRSTWSPCGWSMLSTITPLTERARGHRFSLTATWFVTGAAFGGAALGLVGATLAWLVALADLASTSTGAIAAALLVVAALLDAKLLKPALPHHRRQVNEDWLDEFRPWVYAGGFGVQIGSGLATYIMSGGVYLVVLLGALSGRPGAAFALGLAFGITRGAAVLAGTANTTPVRLARFHQRFASATEPVRLAVAGVYAALAVGVAGTQVGAAAAVVTAALVASGAGAVRARRAQPSGSALIPTSASLIELTSTDLAASDPTTA